MIGKRDSNIALLFAMLLLVQGLFAHQMVPPAISDSVGAEWTVLTLADGPAVTDDCESIGTQCLLQAMATGGCGMSYCSALLPEFRIPGNQAPKFLKTSFSNDYRSVVLDLLTYPPNSYLA
jgi:hypothetical protein